MRKTTRRGFLAKAGKAVAGAAASRAVVSAAAGVVGSALFGVGKAIGGPVFVRRNVAGMAASDPILVSYRKAIKKMRSLSGSNPLSWAYQAAVHYTTVPVPPADLPFWDKCEHGTEFFWSWHRMYLYWFERIIRKMSEDKDWAIPYWNWAPGSDFKLPAPFRVTTSDLYTVNRDPAINAGTGSLNPAAVSVTSSFSLTNYFSTNGNIQNPHGAVHLEVGGTPAGWMYSPTTAAQDPIFYLHHSNVDRQWDLWLAQGGGRSDPTTNATWTGKVYEFHDEDGKVVKMSACEILRAEQQLDYKYEGEPPQVLEYCKKRRPEMILEFAQREELLRLPGPPVELGGQEVTVQIPMRAIRDKAAAVASSATDTLLLQLDGLEAELQPGVAWGVWVGLAKGAQAVAEIPSHVGALSLFGAGIRGEMAHGEFMPAKAVFPLNRAMQEALKTGGENVEIRFVPLGILIDGKPTTPQVKATVKIGKISVVVERGTAAQ